MPIALRLTLETYTPTAATPAVTVEIDSISFDAVQVLHLGSQSSGAGAGKVTFNPFSVSRKPDANSADLWLRLCSGTAYRMATVTATHPGATAPFFSFTMGIVAVRTMAFSSAETDAEMKEVITFECGQAAYAASSQNPDGSAGTLVGSAWDLVKNIKIDPKMVGSGVQ